MSSQDLRGALEVSRAVGSRAINADEELKAELHKTFTPDDLDLLPQYIKKAEEDYVKERKKWYRPATFIIPIVVLLVVLIYLWKLLIPGMKFIDLMWLFLGMLPIFAVLGFFLATRYSKKRISSMTREQRLKYYAGLELSEKIYKEQQQKTD